ncbi:MAG: tyrosine-type recombinase/integrase [Chloroflexota bacterium]
MLETTTALTVMADQDNEEDTALWAACYEHWLEAVERRRGSARSRVEYAKAFKNFLSFMDGKHPALITGADCQRWVHTMQEEGLAKTTVKTRLGAVSSFYKFATTRFERTPNQYLHNFNPTTLVQRPHINPYEKAKGLNVEQVRALLKGCDRATVAGSRDYALLCFYLYTSRRRSEIVRLCWSDLRDGREVGLKEYRYIGKGGKGGWRDLPEPVWKALEWYLKASGRLEKMQADSPLFMATHDRAKYLPGRTEPNLNKPIGESTINYVVEQAAKRAGLEHVTVHTLRHTAAKLRRATGATLEEVSEFLDHSSLATTQIYLNNTEARQDMGWRKVQALVGLG